MSVAESIVSMLIGRREIASRTREEQLTRLEHLLYLDAKGEKLGKGGEKEIEQIIVSLDLSHDVVATMASQIRELVEMEAQQRKVDDARAKAGPLETQIDAFEAETKRMIDERNAQVSVMNQELRRLLDFLMYQAPKTLEPMKARYPGATLNPPKSGEPRRLPFTVKQGTEPGWAYAFDHEHPAEPRAPKLKGRSFI